MALELILNAIAGAFGNEIDYATITKIYRKPPEGDERRYHPGECCGIEKNDVKGRPDPKPISTGYIERRDLTTKRYW